MDWREQVWACIEEQRFWLSVLVVGAHISVFRCLRSNEQKPGINRISLSASRSFLYVCGYQVESILRLLK